MHGLFHVLNFLKVVKEITTFKMNLLNGTVQLFSVHGSHIIAALDNWLNVANVEFRLQLVVGLPADCTE